MAMPLSYSRTSLVLRKAASPKARKASSRGATGTGE
jgi:hypothetical protein